MSRITRSICISLISLWLLQTLLFLAIVITKDINPAIASSFFLVNSSTHAALLIFLIILRGLFYKVPSGERLTRVNLANLLTMIRVSCIPAIAYLLLLARDHRLVTILLIYTAIAFLTDFFDGLISRLGNQMTKIGQYLDSISDYAILIVISIAFYYYKLVSPWIFYLILARLLFQWIGAAAIFLYHGKVSFHTSFLGKASVFAIMTLYAISLLKLIPAISNWANKFVHIMEYVAAAVVILSILDKMMILYWDFRHAMSVKMLKKINGI